MSAHPSTEDHLCAWWSKKEKDITFGYPSKPDGHLLYGFMCIKRQRFDGQSGKVVFDPSFIEELEARGYDITTLRFSVKRKWKSGEQPPEGWKP